MWAQLGPLPSAASDLHADAHTIIVLLVHRRGWIYCAGVTPVLWESVLEALSVWEAVGRGLQGGYVRIRLLSTEQLTGPHTSIIKLLVFYRPPPLHSGSYIYRLTHKCLPSPLHAKYLKERTDHGAV